MKMDKIDYLIPIYQPKIGKEERENLLKAFDSGWISSKGEFIKKFEDKFADWNGIKYASSSFNGTTSLHLALEALGITKNDKVIVPNFTFISPANMIKLTGAHPLLVDVRRDDWCIDYVQLDEIYTPDVKAIIAVHLYGTVAKMDEIVDFAEDKDLRIIEDVAEALGADYKGTKAGNFGDISCYSFYGNKIITTGEGGIAATNNEELKEKLDFLKNHAMSPTNRYWHERVAFNYKMTNLQASIGLAQIDKIDGFIKSKRKNWMMMSELFEDISGIEPQQELQDRKNIFWLNSVLLPKGIDADSVSQRLSHENIDNRRFFVPLNKMPQFLNNSKFPISKELYQRGISLPSSVDLSENEIHYIYEKLKSILNEFR
jgi:perosamine synthetase